MKLQLKLSAALVLILATALGCADHDGTTRPTLPSTRQLAHNSQSATALAATEQARGGGAYQREPAPSCLPPSCPVRQPARSCLPPACPLL